MTQPQPAMYSLLEGFLSDFPWSDNMRHKLRVTADRDDVKFILACKTDGKLTASAYTRQPKPWPNYAVAVWCRHPVTDAGSKSKTQQAVELVEKRGLTPHAAAKQLGLSASAVYRALDRVQERTICPCCRQVVRDGFEIDESVLKIPSDGPASS